MNYSPDKILPHTTAYHGSPIEASPKWSRPEGAKIQEIDPNPLGIKAPGAPGNRTPLWMCITYSILHAPQRFDQRRHIGREHYEEEED